MYGELVLFLPPSDFINSLELAFLPHLSLIVALIKLVAHTVKRSPSACFRLRSFVQPQFVFTSLLPSTKYQRCCGNSFQEMAGLSTSPSSSSAGNDTSSSTKADDDGPSSALFAPLADGSSFALLESSRTYKLNENA